LDRGRRGSGGRENVEDVAGRLEAGPRELVVQPDPGPLRHQLAPEDVAQGLRRGDHVPLPVRHTKCVVCCWMLADAEAEADVEETISEVVGV
jgi:hypothetical protein